MKRIISVFLILLLALPCSVFAENAPTEKPEAKIWICLSCGNIASGNFCNMCGMPAPTDEWICTQCWHEAMGNFCSNCGSPRPAGAVSAPEEPAREEQQYETITVRMEGMSMSDALNDGDILTAILTGPEDIRRFDIVICHYPGREDTNFVKRVVGLPGEVVEIREGYLYVDGVRYEEEYINDAYRVRGGSNGLFFGPYEVPQDCYFVMGDHRNNSNDSRSIGALPADLIVGIVTAVNDQSIGRE